LIKNDLENIIVIFKDCFCYYSSKGELYGQISYSLSEDPLIIILTSLIACLDCEKYILSALDYNISFRHEKFTK